MLPNKVILLIDNYDSFTYMLRDYILQTGKVCEVIKNDACSIEEIKKLSPDAIVLSPGPKTPDDAGITMEVIAAFHQSVPMLGVCLGHQAIGQYFGATVAKARVPMHGYTTEINILHAHPIFNNIEKKITVMRYHSLIVKDLPDTLLSLAETDEQEIMALAHKQFPIVGLQFHPESALTPAGLQLIKNWVAAL